jgi:hypothetical protein
MIQLVLSIDSFSRRHFYRKLPKTVEFLNNLNNEGRYAAFDHKIHNLIGADTAENLAMVFGNKWIGLRYRNTPQDRYEE